MKEKRERKIQRVIKILRLLSQGGWVPLYRLEKELGVTKRTIHRDIKLLKEAGFPIVRKSPKSGLYSLSKRLDREIEMLSEYDIAFILAFRDAMTQMGASFAQSAQDIISRLLDIKADFVNVGMDFPLTLTPRQERTMGDLLNAIRAKRRVAFSYQGFPGHRFQVKPYKLGFFRGFWYLVAEDSGKVKSFAIDKIQKLETLTDKFQDIPRDLEAMTDFTPFITWGERVKVKIKTLPEATGYFKRKRFALVQELVEAFPDGSAVFELQGRSYPELENTVIKQWLPHILILEPREFAEALEKSMENWLARQREKAK